MIKLYTKIPCPHCEPVKDYIKQCNIPVEIINLGDEPELLSELKAKGLRTVPCLDVDGRLIPNKDTIITYLGTC